MDVGALARHVARMVLIVGPCLDARPPRRGRLVTAAEYYLTDTPAAPDPAIDEPDALVAAYDGALVKLRDHFAREPSDRAVAAPGDVPMLLDEYLVTRILELVVHADDLASSIGEPMPEFGPVAMACTVGCLLEMARLRNGDLAVVRAIARPERDDVHALRVL